MMKSTTSTDPVAAATAMLTDKPAPSRRHARSGLKTKPTGFTQAQLDELRAYLRQELRDELIAELKPVIKAEILEELKPKQLRNLTATEAGKIMSMYSDRRFVPYPGIKHRSGIDSWTPKYWIREWLMEKLSQFKTREEAIAHVEKEARKTYYCPATWTAFLHGIDQAAGLTEPKEVSVQQE
jgi:hypothetical protein